VHVKRGNREHLVRDVFDRPLAERRFFLDRRRQNEVPASHRLDVTLAELSEAWRVTAGFLILPTQFTSRLRVSRFLSHDTLEGIRRRASRGACGGNAYCDTRRTAATVSVPVAVTVAGISITVAVTIAVPTDTTRQTGDTCGTRQLNESSPVKPCHTIL
jgi:hypothetical protein